MDKCFTVIFNESGDELKPAIYAEGGLKYIISTGIIGGMSAISVSIVWPSVSSADTLFIDSNTAPSEIVESGPEVIVMRLLIWLNLRSLRSEPRKFLVRTCNLTILLMDE